MANRKGNGDRAELERVEKMEKLLEHIAYGSLVLDFMIAVITLLSINTGTYSVGELQRLVNYAITAVLIVSAVLFIAIRVMVHYEKIIDHFAQYAVFGGNGKKKRGQRRL